jgi:uncharacterized protein YndB with AHSA1/START domain
MIRSTARRSIAVALLASAALVAPAYPARAEYKQVPVVRHVAQTEVAASPAAVWAQLTQGKNLVTWCPIWKGAANAKASLAKVGDVLDFTDEYGHGGRSVVTYLVRDKELRVAHEPNDGSYLCQAKITLTPKGKSTLVEYVEQYTDESSPADLDATAKKMEGEMATSMAALKKSAERR